MVTDLIGIGTKTPFSFVGVISFVVVPLVSNSFIWSSIGLFLKAGFTELIFVGADPPSRSKYSRTSMARTPLGS